MTTVDFPRLRDSLDELARIGRGDDGGITRPGFSAEDMRARRWLIDRLRERGLHGRLDEAANVIGSRPDDAAGPAVLIGSHLDTVPGGGSLDGALGVLVGLECLTRLHENGVSTRRPVELIAFSDEEGRFGGMFGSRAFSGMLTPADIHGATDLDGGRLVEAMAERGLDAEQALRARRAPETVDSYLELHIEQGPVLDRLGRRAGLVTDITGLFKWVVRLTGQPDHAGTTPMTMRRDALGGLAEFADEIPRLLEENGSDRSTATIGTVHLAPGTANTVPGVAEFSLDVRDPDAGVLEELAVATRKALSAIGRRRSLMFEFDIVSEIAPTRCDERIVHAIRAAAATAGVPLHEMPSGAAHDAQMVAALAPVGMIFAPSRDGRSHCPAEWTHWEDIELAANLTLHAIMRLAVAAEHEEIRHGA